MIRTDRTATLALTIFLLLSLGRITPVFATDTEPVRAPNGMVVSAHRLASEAGTSILKKGGNAVDAAVATGFALAVVYPAAGNIGGGGFMVVRLADGTSTTFDFREKAPAAATRDMYLSEGGEVDSDLSRVGHRSSGVPGSVAGLLEAHARFGSLSREEVLDPAIRLACAGHTLSAGEAVRLNKHRETFLRFSGSREIFLKADDRPWEEGELFVQSDLAATLERIRKEGSPGFYSGHIAELLVAEMKGGGGLITAEDLLSYTVVERPPVHTRYRGCDIISMGPPSSGGVALAQLLHMVEPFDLNEMGFLSSRTIHLMSEAERRVYADRAEFLGDSDFVSVPVRELMRESYARKRMESFSPCRTTPSVELQHGNPVQGESEETTHYSVVDRHRNAVSVTTTLNGAYGSYVTVRGAGFLLNNEMDDFSAKPGVPNMYGLVGAEANAIEPGKRMLSSMTPTIVVRDGSLFMVLGTPGGSTIITTVFQVLLNVVDHGMNIQAAVSAPRVHHQWLPDRIYYEPGVLTRDVIRDLMLRGHELYEREGISGRADCILVEPNDTLSGGADPRGEDAAVGY